MQQKKKMETYKCLNVQCKHDFTGKPGPIPCPKCKHRYVEWVSFKLWNWNKKDLWHRKIVFN